MQRATRNQLTNLANPFQGPEPRVLFVCSAAMLRSVTAAQLFCQAPWNWNTRSAGTNQSFALTPVSEALVQWADTIFLMEFSHFEELQEQVTLALGSNEWNSHVAPKCKVLGIPDMFNRMAPELVELLKDIVLTPTE